MGHQCKKEQPDWSSFRHKKSEDKMVTPFFKNVRCIKNTGLSSKMMQLPIQTVIQWPLSGSYNPSLYSYFYCTSHCHGPPTLHLSIGLFRSHNERQGMTLWKDVHTSDRVHSITSQATAVQWLPWGTQISLTVILLNDVQVQKEDYTLNRHMIYEWLKIYCYGTWALTVQ